MFFVLSVGVCLRASQTITTQVLWARRQYRKMACVTAIDGVLCIVLSIPLALNIGPLGICWGWFLGSVICCAVIYPTLGARTLGLGILSALSNPAKCLVWCAVAVGLRSIAHPSFIRISTWTAFFTAVACDCISYGRNSRLARTQSPRFCDEVVAKVIVLQDQNTKQKKLITSRFLPPSSLETFKWFILSDANCN